MEADLALTLAGGGNRAFFQTGVINRWGQRLWPRLRVIAGCSAGACVAVMTCAGRAEPAHAYWKQRLQGIERNLDLSNLLRGRPPAPHGEVYWSTVRHAMLEGGLERLRSMPFPVLVLTAALPKWCSTLPAVALGLSAYNLEKRLSPDMVHPSYGRRLGFEPRVFDARDCESPESVADLILASSATPPFTPVGRFAGETLLDGGMVDNVPAFVAEQVPGVRRNLVLLTRPYPAASLGRKQQRLYIAPSRPTPIDRWDYTKPERLEETIAMGERESALHESALATFLASFETLSRVEPAAQPEHEDV